jgi:hypothetical protein
MNIGGDRSHRGVDRKTRDHPEHDRRRLDRDAGRLVRPAGAGLIRAGLVDEYRLFVYPIVQGRGRRLFPDGYELPRMRLIESRSFRGGITYSRYAGA